MYQLNMDCEGPLTQNDNAFELCEKFIPSGGKFFAIVSKYDDFLADVIKRPGYKAGDTLKLVLPFLKAYGVTDEDMEKFSQKTLVLLPGTETMLPKVNDMLPSFIISTSYKPYIEALCHVTSFPMDHCYCTQVSLDVYEIDPVDADKLKGMAQEISQMEMIKWPSNAKGIQDLSSNQRRLIHRLDEIFWKQIPSMSIGRLLEDVNPIGGKEKARAVTDSLEKTGLSPDRVIYVGDSITDVQALDLVKGAGGLAVSFNGNRYAIEHAEIAILSSNTSIIFGISSLCIKDGMDAVRNMFVNGPGRIDNDTLFARLRAIGTDTEMLTEIENTAQNGTLELYNIGACHKEELVYKSEKVRKEVRGHKVGTLG